MMAEMQAHRGTGKKSTKRSRSQVSIDMLPDVALLTVFDFCVDNPSINAWHTLVHVCQKWRDIVFDSPRRLDLRLLCKTGKQVREMLDIWPPLPIAICGEMWIADEILAALEHNDRISQCALEFIDIPHSQFEKVLLAMQKPFPELKYLQLHSYIETALVIPTSFLGGSAPLLQTLILYSIPFPGLPKLLLSAAHLVVLDLRGIPYSSHISPETMVTCLSVLTRLESLALEFDSPRSRPDQKSRRWHLPTRTLLPVLRELWFKGASAYLEDLVAQIDAPLLDKLCITYFHQVIFDTPQVTQFIDRTPNLEGHDRARVLFSDRDVSVEFPQSLDGALRLGISCRQLDQQLLSLTQVCSSSLPRAFISTVDHLHITPQGFLGRQDDIENGHWLELFHLFTNVKALYIFPDSAPRVAFALQGLIGESVTEVLPSLQTLVLEDSLSYGPVMEAIGQFVAARQLSSHPVAISFKTGFYD